MAETPITKTLIDESLKSFDEGVSKIISNGIIKSGIDDSSYNHEAFVKMSRNFSDEIEPMDITNQKKSGRCWIFAGMNVLRYFIKKNYDIKDKAFELSQSYMMFWDKLEKANYFLESVIETAGEKKDSRIVMWLFQNPLNDGGQWDMLVSLIQKYGVVPKYAMPESFHSSESAKMNAVLCKKLRLNGVILRKMFESGETAESLRKCKEGMIKEFFTLMCAFLGVPPKTFDFEYRDSENKFHRDSGLSPLDFYKKYFGGYHIEDYVSVINAPTDDKPFDGTYTVKYLGNVVGRPVLYLNLKQADVERLAAAQIQDGDPVWFGSDVGKYSDRQIGIMDTALFDYDKVLGVDLGFSKADMLDYGESCLTHAMALVGVDINDGEITKWKVENSWGKDVGKDGFFIMSNDWFKTYACQIVVNKKYLSEKQKAALKKPPVELEPWDPIGSLAL